MTLTADKLIQDLELIAHPEGGYYRETYRSDLVFNAPSVSDRFTGPRCCCTTIYFLLRDKEFSAFHRIKADEIWHFYSGSPLVVHVIQPQGVHMEILLGPDPDQGQVFQAVVPAGCWFAATLVSGSGYALVGCATAPGFEFDDFEMAQKDQLTAAFPHLADLIDTFTR